MRAVRLSWRLGRSASDTRGVEFVTNNLLGPLLAAILTAVYLRGSAAPGDVKRHDGQVADLNQVWACWRIHDGLVIGAWQFLNVQGSRDGLD